MKRLLNVLLLLAMAMAASAQVSWNVSGGVGMAFPSFEQKSNAGVAAKLSVGCEIPLSSNISFIPTAGLEFMEADFIGLNEYYNWEIRTYEPRYNVEALRISRPMVSLLFGYRVPIGSTDCSIMAELGPYVGYTFEEFLGNDGSVNAGIDAGVYFEYRRFIMGVNLEYDFTKTELNPHWHYIGDLEFTNRVAFFNIGYKF